MHGVTILMWLGCAQTEKEQEVISEPAATPEPEPAQEPSTDAPCEPQVWYADADLDGFGNPYDSTEACTAPDGYIEDNRDCNDADAQEFPGQTWYADQDQDGYGDGQNAIEKCSRPFGYVLDGTDCDDTDETRYPSAVWYTDTDGDGFGDTAMPEDACTVESGYSPLAGDCDDTDYLIHPAANEICDNIDNDCDELIDDLDDSIDVYTQVAMYVDLDLDGYGTEEYIQQACPSTELGALVTGDCDDTDPMVNPNQMELQDEVDQNCDGDSLHHPTTIIAQGFLKTLYPIKTLVSADVDGDGSRDLLMHMPKAEADTGNVTLLTTIPDTDFTDLGSAGSIDWTGEAPGDQFGQGVTLVGDMDGNGVNDVLVSAPGAGKVYLLSSDTPSGSATAAQWYWQSSNVNSRFGNSIISLGDIDGDGVTESMVSAPDFSAAGTNAGAIFLLDNDDINTSHDAMENHFVYGESGWARLGTSMDNIGDADGDGIDDVIISAWGSHAAYASGTVYLVPTNDIFSATFSLPDATFFHGHETQAKAGSLVRGIGDYNGDGHQDFIIRSEDRYQLIFGRPDFATENDLNNADAIFTIDENVQWQRVAPAGDLNGDGFHDFLVSYAGSGIDVAYSKKGMVLGFMGNSTIDGTIQLDKDAADFIIAGQNAQRIGMSMAAAGDVDSDGYNDVWISTGRCNSWSQCDTPFEGDTTFLLSGVLLD